MANYSSFGLGKYKPPAEKQKTYSSFGLDHYADDISGFEYLGGKFVSGIESIFKGAENLFRGTFYQLTGNTYAAEKLYATNDPQARSKKLDQQYKANGVMSFLGSVSEGIGQVVPAMALSLVPVVGAPAAAATSFAGHTGMAVGDAYAKTGSLGAKEYIYGIAMGGFETTLEVIGGRVGGWIGGSKLGTTAVNASKGDKLF